MTRLAHALVTGRTSARTVFVFRLCGLIFSSVFLIGDAGADDTAGLSESRVSAGLEVLYTFERPESGLISDQSGSGDPLNLRIDKPQSVRFRNARISIQNSVLIASDGSASRLNAAIRDAGVLTLEVWITPADLRQKGPARIVTLSADPSSRNLTLGQDGARLDLRLRTTGTSENGQPSTATPEGSLETRLTHCVCTFSDDGQVVVYQDGRRTAQSKVSGDLSNWETDFRLAVGNEVTGDRAWLGEIHLVAVYSRVLDAAEVLQNFHAGVPRGVDYASMLPPAAKQKVEFVRDVRPVFERHCYDCHSGDQEAGGLNLGIRRRAIQGGVHGGIIEVGDSAQSRMIHLVAALDPQRVMPPESDGLSADEVGILRAWIDQGAEWPDGTDIPDPRETAARKHWAFQPLSHVEVPAAESASSEIDRFVMAELRKHQLSLQRPASPEQLIRRFTLKLIGLPPTTDEIDEFVGQWQQNSQAATEQLVDRLLDSPQYGERWGRHWLDVARYADSDGQESDRDRPNAYHYRDFIIRAFNSDLPWDQMVRWQLAGDEYEPDNPEAVAAVGFLAAGPFAALPDRLMEDERLRNRYNELDDIMSTVGTGFLGLTLGCVRCHDHKYDAIPARDYYSLMAAFHSGDRAEIPLPGTKEQVLAYRDFSTEPSPAWLFQRGNYYHRDQPVSLGFVSFLTQDKSPETYLLEAQRQIPSRQSTGQRRAVADWITDVEHGAGALLARVFVNRIWQHHFGHGLVRTPGDFGNRAEAPSHPELLEWLAADFVQGGWRIKRMHRRILLSAVSQQASQSQSSGRPADPDNRLLWKMPLMRLEGEILRDSMLAVSGTLNTHQFGPAVRPPISREAILARNLKDGYPDNLTDTPETRRRSIYLFHKRVVPYPLLQAFDKPDAQQTCSRRDQTTVAPQALALLNDPFVRTVSREFAERLMRDVPESAEGQIRRAFRLALSRDADEGEVLDALSFLKESNRPEPLQALTDFCQVIFGLNEFIYVE